MQESKQQPLTHSSVPINPERYVISCVEGIRYRYIRSNQQIYVREKCASGVSSDRESAHGFMDLLWVLGPCKWCRGPLVKVKPLASCQLCLLSYQYLNDLDFHGITTEQITHISYDVDSHKPLELICEKAQSKKNL